MFKNEFLQNGTQIEIVLGQVINKFLSLFMVFVLFASFTGCSGHFMFENEESGIATVPSSCEQTETEHSADHSHHCPTHCNHSLIVLNNLFLGFAESMSVIATPYIFIYENQVLETLERPPLLSYLATYLVS